MGIRLEDIERHAADAYRLGAAMCDGLRALDERSRSDRLAWTRRQQEAEQARLRCPRCGSALVVRHNRTTGHPFRGCTAWPECRYTRNAPEIPPRAATPAPQRDRWTAQKSSKRQRRAARKAARKEQQVITVASKRHQLLDAQCFQAILRDDARTEGSRDNAL